MPKHERLEVLDRIIAADASSNVTLMAAHYPTESAGDAIKKRPADYLNKPVNLQILRERVNALLEDNPGRIRASQCGDCIN
jgi:DNA-binding NtrC family response regulator